MPDTTVAYSCPNCGGPLEMVPGQKKIVCPYCDTEFETAALEKLFAKKEEMAAKAEAAKEAKFDTEAAGKDWTEEEIEHLRTFTCSSCGAELVCDDNTMATECCYCGNPTMIPSRFTGMLKPDFILPFKKSKDEAMAALKKFYEGKFLLPSNFISKNRVEDIQAMYVPFWLFDSKVHASGEFRAELDNVINTPDEVITQTSIYNCSREGTMEFKNIPVDGSKKMNDQYMESLEPFDFSELVPFTPGYMAGCLADKYDVDAEAAAPRADERVHQTALNELEDTVTGYTRCSLTDEAVVKEEGHASYALLPVWILTTRYQDKPYTFMMNGQTGEVVGFLPYDKQKSWMVLAVVTIVMLPIFYFLVSSFLNV